MFNKKYNRKYSQLQAVRVDHYAPQRSRSLSFATVAVGVLLFSALVVWGLRSWNLNANEQHNQQVVEQDAAEPTLQKTQTKEQASTDSSPNTKVTANNRLSRAQLREVLSPYIDQGIYPTTIDSPTNTAESLSLNYTLDKTLQAWADKRLAHYNPDYGVFVALDPDTGKILALASSRRDHPNTVNLATKATYPAASTIKVITAAAILEEGKASPDTVYAFNGKSTSLYKRQVLNHKDNKWTRRFSLERAFAKSVNPIFGRIGVKTLGGETLLKYAQKFGFNAQFMTDFEFDNGSIDIDLNDEWQVAESASGYTRRNTLSPIHGATIAAAVANGGFLIAPRIIESVSGPNSPAPLYTAGEARKLKVLSPSSVKSMQTLMDATVKIGTGRRVFKRFFRKDYKDVVAGGKTGHLSGANPKGSYDWFIGYGKKDNKKIAFAMLCINTDKWYVKSAQFAREALEHYFKTPDEPPQQIRAISKNESVS